MIRTEPDPAWERFAASEPWFAVLTHPKYLRTNLDEAAEEEFFRTGADHVRRVLDLVRSQYRVTPGSVLEYGCGPGRLAIPFAQHARNVAAVDVSRAMLAIARAVAAKQNVTNITFQLVTEFLAEDVRFDLVNCHLVLQRLAREEAVELLKLLLARVAPGGVSVIHFPYRSASTPLVSATRWAREHVPGVNSVANLLRGKPASSPFIATHTFDLEEALMIVKEAGLDAAQAFFAHDGDLDEAVIYAHRKVVAELPSPAQSEVAQTAPVVRAEGVIDVRELIARTSIDDLNRRAEVYFASLDSWESHLAKPFARVGDTPQLLINLGVLFQGLRFWPGQTVLDFGAGTGWLSRILTQLGAKAIVMDVSATALEIARELYAKMPVIGERPAPRFLLYDGRRINLPDESVDRIVCFDAFHHAPDPGAVLRDFARVLKRGGVAGFAEPGPHHSRSPQSQFEMRAYQVVENDVDIHQIWRDAQAAGFVDLKLAASNVPPFHVTLEDYDDLLAGGGTHNRWAEATRGHLANARNFFLTKAGTEPSDSREVSGLEAAIDARIRSEVRPGEPIELEVTVTNTGRAHWLPSTERTGGVSVGVHLSDGEGNLIELDYHWEPLPQALGPGEGLTLSFRIPPLASGRYRLEVDCVASDIAWFAQLGSSPAVLSITV